ncbi:MAG: transporter [Alphaproteobacteria bacterium]
MTKFILMAGVAGFITFNSAVAQEVSISSHDHHNHAHHGGHDHSVAPLAPISVMGDHMHPKGEWMVSYRRSHMMMEENRNGTSRLSNDEIATSVANRFSGVAGQPPTLRVVPTEMSMNMHMIGAMYGATDWLTLMAMGMYMEKDMSHVTYQGGAGTTVLGTFDTNTEGWGDTVLSGLVKLHDAGAHNVHLNLELSLPTGSITEEGNVLTPMNMRPRVRLPYAMQLGSGTYDLHPGLTYNGHRGDYSWGAQYKAEIRLEDENDEGYAWGDKHSVTAWAGYRANPVVSVNGFVRASTQEAIDGIDADIVLPVQTADPDNYGSEVVEAGLGFNFKGQSGWMRGHSAGFDVAVPLYQNLNGPQLERDYTITFGLKASF